MYFLEYIETDNDSIMSFRYNLEDKEFSIYLDSHPEYDLNMSFYDKELDQFIKDEKLQDEWGSFKEDVNKYLTRGLK